MPEGGLTLYAQWETSEQITITYRYNYNRYPGSPVFDSQDCSIESPVSIIDGDDGIPWRFGYVFLGWSTSSSGDPEYFPGDTYITGTNDVTLYAQWGNIRTSDLNPRVLHAKSATVTYNGATQTVSGVNEGTGNTQGLLKVGSYRSFWTDYTIYADISDIQASGIETGHYSTPSAAKLYVYSNRYGLEDLDQYIEVEKGVLTINQVEVTVSTDGVEEDYDGNPHTAGGSVVVGGDTSTQQTFSHNGGTVTLVNGETLNIRTTGSQTEVGSSQNTFEVDWGAPEWGSEATAKNYNYKIKKGTIGTLKVKESEKVKIEYKVAPDHSGTVDKAQEIIDAAGEAIGSTATAGPGYTFDKWTKGEENVGTEAHFVPSKNTEGKYEAATYTANFTEDEIKITFAADGHGSVTNQNGVTVGGVDVKADEVSGSIATAEDGYKLDGWYVGDTKVSGDSELTAAQVAANLTEAGKTDYYTYYDDTTFTAIFVPVEYKITYNLQGGSVSGNPTTYTIESAPITLNNPTSDKYTFLGWTGAGLSGDTMEVTIPTGSTGDRTYKAEWQFTVTYHTNYSPTATDNPKTVTARLGSAIVIKSFEALYGFDPTGVVFAGWARTADGRAEYQAGNTIRDTADLYAIWVKTGIPQAAATVTYTAKLEDGTVGGGKVTIPTETLNGHWGNYWIFGPIEYDEPIGCTASAYANYEFVGWYKGDTLVCESEQMIARDVLGNMNTKDEQFWWDIIGLFVKEVYDSTDFVAKFKPKTFDVTYVINGEKPSTYNPPEGKKGVEVGSTVTVEEVPADIEGTDSEGVPGTWSFNSNGWTAPEGVTVEDGKFSMPAKNVEFTGTWTFTPKTYTVTWLDENGTELEKDENVAYKVMPSYDGETPTKAADAQYTYTFDKWSPELAEVTEDVTYTATYTSTVNQYKVKFVDEDGETVLLEETEYPYGTPAGEIQKPADPTKAADSSNTYTFAGWDPEIADVTGDATYKATYTATPIPAPTPTPTPTPAGTTDDDDDDDDAGNADGGGAAAAAAAPAAAAPAVPADDIADEPTPTTERKRMRMTRMTALTRRCLQPRSRELLPESPHRSHSSSRRIWQM